MVPRGRRWRTAINTAFSTRSSGEGTVASTHEPSLGRGRALAAEMIRREEEACHEAAVTDARERAPAE